jgi:hypothetical protein
MARQRSAGRLPLAGRFTMAREGDIVQPPWNGAVPAGGLAAVIRIAIPGYKNLAIELSPRNFAGRSTSSLFFQDLSGKRVLRLDYQYNARTRTIDYHWTQGGTFENFGIADPTPAGAPGAALYRGARVFKYLGRAIAIVGAMGDFVSVVTASNPLRRSTQVITAWALAYAAAETTGPAGALRGTPFGPPGIPIGGIVFAIGGGSAGYTMGEIAGADVYDWGNATFQHLSEAANRGQFVSAR